jgi:hypothetical protein
LDPSYLGGVKWVGNRKSIGMKNSISSGNVDLTHCNYMEFNASKNFLVFRTKM